MARTTRTDARRYVVQQTCFHGDVYLQAGRVVALDGEPPRHVVECDEHGTPKPQPKRGPKKAPADTAGETDAGPASPPETLDGGEGAEGDVG